MDRLPAEVVPDLEWVQTVAGHELRGAGSFFADLRFDSRSVAIGRTIDERWEFRREGWFSQEVAVRAGAGGEILAKMALDGDRAGILVDPRNDRRVTTLDWSHYGSWDTEDDWVIRYHNSSGPRTFQARVEIARQIVHLSGLPLLVTLGWYLKVLPQWLNDPW